jgi:hypothetical protein
VNAGRVADCGGVGRYFDRFLLDSRFFTFRGAVYDETSDGRDGIGGGGILESAR